MHIISDKKPEKSVNGTQWVKCVWKNVGWWSVWSMEEWY